MYWITCVAGNCSSTCKAEVEISKTSSRRRLTLTLTLWGDMATSEGGIQGKAYKPPPQWRSPTSLLRSNTTSLGTRSQLGQSPTSNRVQSLHDHTQFGCKIVTLASLWGACLCYTMTNVKKWCLPIVASSSCKLNVNEGHLPWVHSKKNSPLHTKTETIIWCILMCYSKCHNVDSVSLEVTFVNKWNYISNLWAWHVGF